MIRTSDKVASSNPAWDSSNPDPASSNAPFRIFNIGNSAPVPLMTYIDAVEETLGRKAKLELLPLQPGDVPDTFADVSELQRHVDYRPATPVRDGVARFVAWYREYYKV